MNTIEEIIAKYSTAKITKTAVMDAGLESEVALVELDDGSKVVTKYAKPGRYPNYILEANAYRRLGALGARVPQVLQVDEVSLVMSLLAGGELDDQEELYTNKPLFEDIAEDLALCWKVEYEGFGSIDIEAYRADGSIKGVYASWADFLARTEQSFDRLAASGQLDTPAIDAIRKYWSDHQGVGLEKGRLVHGDLAMSAIFVDGDRYCGLIDFGDAIMGDPVMDLAYFKFKEINKDYGPVTYENLSQSYRRLVVPELLADYETRINLYMIYWGTLRVLDCPEPELVPKFAAKLKAVVEQLG